MARPCESEREPVHCTLAELDRAFVCVCGAEPGHRCRGMPRNRVHLGRRLRALFATVEARQKGHIVLVDVN
jgi:hypothetical protein